MGQFLIGHHGKLAIDRGDRTTWARGIVLESSPQGVFDDAAMHAVHSWVFAPDTVDGVRQRKRIQWRLEFKP